MHRPIDEPGFGDEGDGTAGGPVPVPPPYRPHPAPGDTPGHWTGVPAPPTGPWADGHGAPDPGRVDPRVLGALLARHGWRRRG
ncbi:hypothetical protein ACFW89_35275, partial [Streptomyces albidoflavus]